MHSQGLELKINPSGNILDDALSTIELGPLKDRLLNEIVRSINYEWQVKTFDELQESLLKSDTGFKKTVVEFIFKFLPDIPPSEVSIPCNINRSPSGTWSKLRTLGPIGKIS